MFGGGLKVEVGRVGGGLSRVSGVWIVWRGEVAEGVLRVFSPERKH